MRRLSSFMSWVAAAMAMPLESRLVKRRGTVPLMACHAGHQLASPLRTDNGRAPLPPQDGLYRSFAVDREHDDRHMIFLGKREGGRVHDFQPAIERLPMGQVVIALGIVVLLGVGAVNPIDVCRLQYRAGADLGRP